MAEVDDEDLLAFPGRLSQRIRNIGSADRHPQETDETASRHWLNHAAGDLSRVWLDRRNFEYRLLCPYDENRLQNPSH